MKKIKWGFPILILLAIFGVLFFYKLGTSYLENWDEAWYASITREMLRSKDFIHLRWNGFPFVDHPPFAMWLMAVSYMVFGIHEFSTRLPSAILGLFSIMIIYLLSYELFKRKSIAFISSFLLGSCIWYIVRVRSGNLDSSLVFFYLLTGYLSVKSAKNIKLLPLTFLSYGLLVLTKTLVGFPMVLLILFWNYQHLKKFSWILLSLLVFLLVVGLWYIPNILSDPNFIHRHFFEIGLREKGINSFLHIYLNQNLFYLHNGIGKWYYPFLLSLLISGVFIFSVLKRKELGFILIWFLLVSYPFFTSSQTQIWHLIPVYIPIALLVPYIMYRLASIPKIKYMNGILTLCIGLLLSGLNFKTYYKNIFPESDFVPDEVAIAKDAGNDKAPLYLNGEFTPRAVFYSGKNVTVFAYKPDSLEKMIDRIKQNNLHQLIITNIRNEQNIKDQEIKFERIQKKGDLVLLKVR